MWVAVGGGILTVILGVVAWRWLARRDERLAEPEQIEDLPAPRVAELIRGTGLHLRQMRYRYSIRPERGGRACFTRVVNTVRLGFVPVVIADNQSDREEPGYAAFVYDENRWRAPGLPCAGDQQAAIEHAARCVRPVSDDEEMKG